MVGILPLRVLPLGVLERSHQKYRITLSPFPISLPSFVQIRPVFEEIMSEMSSRFNIGVKPVGFSPTTSYKTTVVFRHFRGCEWHANKITGINEV